MAPYTATTLADLQTLMVQRWDSVVFWTPEEARLALNEALREWNLLTGRWRTRVSLDINGPGTPVIPSSDVPLPGVLTYAMRITTAAGLPLHPTSLTEFGLGRPTWATETTASGGDVPTRPLLWAPVSLTAISIWPTLPGPGPSLGALLCDGVLTTPILVAPTDPVNLGEEIIDVIVDFALHVAAFKEAGSRWRATRPYFDAFLTAAAEENSLLKQHQAYRRFAGLDRRRDLQPTTGAPTQMTGVAAQFSRHEPTGGGA
jgi:hypothetical protein